MKFGLLQDIFGIYLLNAMFSDSWSRTNWLKTPE